MLNFNYSWIYDQNIHWWNRKRLNPNSYKKTSSYIKKLENKWNKIDKTVFDTISELSNLKWKNKEIECYVVNALIYSFSVPLTITTKNDLDQQIEILIHELIHNIWIQNLDKIKIKDYNKYGKLNQNTKIHILVHAIEKEVLIKLFGDEKTKKYIKTYDKSSDYKKAWNIVEKEGSRRIIREWIK